MKVVLVTYVGLYVIIAVDNLMEEADRIAAFFDFDGVLFKGHFWSEVTKYFFRHKMNRLQLSTYVGTHIPLWLVSKFRILTEEGYKIKWGEDLAHVFKGFTREQGLEIFRLIGQDYVMKALRPDVMTLVRLHRKQGHILVLLSGSFGDFLETIKQDIGVDYVVGTKLELVNDRYTGRIVKPLCFGINKARLLQEFIDQAQLHIDLGRSFAYADSIVDAPVLEMVGYPAATYPDKKLLNLARLRGWQIFPEPVNP